jgi:hypothetical protein
LQPLDSEDTICKIATLWLKKTCFCSDKLQSCSIKKVYHLQEMKSIKALLVLFIVLFISPGVFVFGTGNIFKSHQLEGKIVDAGYLLQGSLNDIEILFFGYVGCGSVCPQSLQMLSGLIEQLKCDNSLKKIGAVFADVASIETMVPADYYARSISPAIKGVNLNKEELTRAHRDFGVVARQTGRSHLEISHTDHFFVLERTAGKESDLWMIKSVWPNRVDADQIRKSLLTE